ncbi:hypothetical protein BS47DRAFT_1392599 [Hydnum rufescens UP504]|uniref:Uncharacterized protein n=1 Tax=Hydnum rufescens UP504 TaxID=1448309 RepID=A0A9P6DX79_9AGAM|nr:hypothetical protein BS47DRAFT_1392599 [Hydnum rufescens UP504]
MSSSQALMKEIWEKETSSVRTSVEMQRQVCYDAVVAKWEQAQLSSTQTPEQYQNAIDYMHPFLEQVAEIVSINTGFAIMILCGGPSPTANGNLVTSQGKTVEDHPLDFRSFAHELFNDAIMPKYSEFVNVVYSKEVCDAQSLWSLRSGSIGIAPAITDSEDVAVMVTNSAHCPHVMSPNHSCSPSLDHSFGLDDEGNDHGSDDECAVFGLELDTVSPASALSTQPQAVVGDYILVVVRSCGFIIAGNACWGTSNSFHLSNHHVLGNA